MTEGSNASPLRATMRAITSSLPIGIAVATVAGAFLSPWLIIPGAGAWLLSVGLLAARHRPTREDPDISHLPPSIQAQLWDVTRALDELQIAARSVPDRQRVMFEGIQRDAADVRRSVLELGLRAGDLHRHIEANLPPTLQDRLERLRARLAESDGESSRGETERSIEALERRLERREQLLERLREYRTTIRSLQATAEDLANRAETLATRDEVEYDYDEESPERKISEMKASVAALEEVMRQDTNVIQ